jgi:hypothetical protein
VGGLVRAITGDYGGSRIDAGIAAQAGSAGEAKRDLGKMWEQQQQYAQPWLQTGQAAMTSLANGPGDFMKNWQTDPGYQFRLDQGLKSVQGSAAARGLNQSGATLKALANYGQNMASQEYGNVYNREYGRLSGLAGLGANALSGLQGAAQNYGNQMAGISTGLGNSYAAGQMAHAQGQANADAAQMQLLGMGASAFFSDKRVKKDIEPISKKDLGEFKKALKPYSFKYKDEKYGEGEWAGVMAQDLEKSKLGRTVVEEKDGVKTINLQKLASLGLAMMAG